MNETKSAQIVESTEQRILNLGCGEQMYGTHRVDLYPTTATTHVFDVEEGIKFPDNYFDKIYERNILEHLRNVGFHFKEVYRVLKEGGKFTLITDYAGCRRYYVLGTHEGRYEEKHMGNPKDKHYSLFSKQHIRNHLTHAGFKIMEVEFVHTDYPTHWLDRLMRVFPRIMAVAMK